MKNIKKTSNIFTLSSPHNTYSLKKNNKVINNTPYMSHECQTGTAQSQQVTTIAKLPSPSRL